jgi:hypothetical protein
MIPNSKAFNVPYVNYKPETFRIAHEFGKSNLSIDEALFQSLELCEKRKHELFQEVSEALESDFVMAFIHFPDIVQHLGFLSKGVIEHHYHGLNSFVSELRHIIPKDVFFFILSDHGFDRNTALHSNHGFFSSNIKLENKPKSIFEVHELIKHHLLGD